MYTNQSKTFKEFIEDNSIKLPRFQRKASWNDKKRFELILSTFKNYPLGASILSVETDSNGKKVRYLLDGRQRRDTLTLAFKNPSMIYKWAKAYIGIKDKDTYYDIDDKFDAKLSEFVRDDTDEDKGINVDEAVDGDDSDPAEEDTVEKIKEPQSSDREINILREFITFCAIRKSGNTDGFAAAFDFGKFFDKKRDTAYFYYFYENEKISSTKIKAQIDTYRSQNPDSFEDKDTFISFISSFTSDDKTKEKISKYINEHWYEYQLKMITFADDLDSIYKNRSIAFIETSGNSSSDSQKIFNLINTAGTKLAASEILSAKNEWNAKVEGVPDDYRQAIKKLYYGIFSKNQEFDAVKWDIPAALTYYLEKNGDQNKSPINIFFSFFSGKTENIAKRITIGFQLISGFYSRGVRKTDVEKLYSVSSFWSNWQSNCEDIYSFFKAISQNKFIKLLQSWGKPLSSIIGDMPTLNILCLAYRSYLELGKPSGFATSEQNIFSKNVSILLDTAFYEYQTNQWKGSADARIAENIEKFEKGEDREGRIFHKLSYEESWKKLLDEIRDSLKINNKRIKKSSLNATVFYYSILSGKKGDADQQTEIDHTIPESTWKSVSISEEQKEAMANSIYNLCLLPKNLNGSKNNVCLLGLKSQRGFSDLVPLIAEYEDIAEKDFEKYSDPANFDALKTYKDELYRNAFGEKREEALN